MAPEASAESSMVSVKLLKAGTKDERSFRQICDGDMFSASGAWFSSSEALLISRMSILALLIFKSVSGNLISKLLINVLSRLPMIFIESLFNVKPEASSKLIFLMFALRLSLLNAFMEILALRFLMSTCLALNLPGVCASLSTSNRKLPRRIRMELKRRSIFGFFFIVSLLAKASITNWRFSGLSGVFLLRLTEKPNNRTVENTNLPLSNGRTSKPAAT